MLTVIIVLQYGDVSCFVIALRLQAQTWASGEIFC